MSQLASKNFGHFTLQSTHSNGVGQAWGYYKASPAFGLLEDPLCLLLERSRKKPAVAITTVSI